MSDTPALPPLPDLAQLQGDIDSINPRYRHMSSMVPICTVEALIAHVRALQAENERLRNALQKISDNSQDQTDPNLASQDSWGNYDDVFSDGLRQDAWWAASIARAALAASRREG